MSFVASICFTTAFGKKPPALNTTPRRRVTIFKTGDDKNKKWKKNDWQTVDEYYRVTKKWEGFLVRPPDKTPGAKRLCISQTSQSTMEDKRWGANQWPLPLDRYCKLTGRYEVKPVDY